MLQMMKQHPFFSSLNEDEIECIAGHFNRRVHEPGDIIIAGSETRNELFFIVSGKITASLKLPGSIERKQGEYLPGDFFGEISFFAGRPSFDTFIAEERTELLVIESGAMNSIMENNPGTGIKFINPLMSRTVERFRSSSKFFSDVVQWGENASRRVITDELTGIYNRSFLDDALVSFFEISRSNSKPLALFMMDIDDFRTINSELGREAADGIIREFVDIITGVMSRHGIIARYGGDEFSILLPEAGLEKAMDIAEQIRSSVEEHNFGPHLQGRELKITTSIGISVFPETATELSRFRELADSSLYRAKKEGKNRTACIME